MLEAVITASALIVIILVVRIFARRKISARLMYALWGLVLLRLVLPFSLINSSVSVMNAVEDVHPYENVQKLEGYDQIELVQSGVVEAYHHSDYSRDFPTPIDSNVSTREFESLQKTLNFRDFLIPLWIGGGILVGLWFIATNAVFSARLKKSRKPFECEAKLPVFVADSLDSPCLFGLFAPKVYLTSKATERGNIEHVLLHEYCHFLHGDNFWAVLRCICLAMYWWNPLVWIAAILSKHDGELACDEAVILRIGEENRLAYGKTLVSMIAIKNHPTNPMCAATTMTGGKESIKKRISAITHRRKSIFIAVVAVVLLAAVAVGCTFTGSSGGDSQSEESNLPFDVPYGDVSLGLYINGEQAGLHIQSEELMDESCPALFARYDWQELTPDEVLENLADNYAYVLDLRFYEDLCTSNRLHNHLCFFAGSDLVRRTENNKDTWYKTSYAPTPGDSSEASENISLCRALRLEYDEAEIYSIRVDFPSKDEDFAETAKLGIEKFCERLKYLSPDSTYQIADFRFSSADVQILSVYEDETEYTIKIPVNFKTVNGGTNPTTFNWVIHDFMLQFSRSYGKWFVSAVIEDPYSYTADEIERLYKNYGMKLKNGSRNATELWDYIVKWTHNHEPDMAYETEVDEVDNHSTYTWYREADEFAELLYPIPVYLGGEELYYETLKIILDRSETHIDSISLSYSTEKGEHIDLYFVDNTLAKMSIGGNNPEDLLYISFNYTHRIIAYTHPSGTKTLPMPDSLTPPGVVVPEDHH